MNDRRPSFPEDDDALDALLASARWPELDADATAGLRRTLHETRPRRIGPMVALAAAAAIALVVTVVVRRGGEAPPVVARTDDPVRSTEGRPAEAGTPVRTVVAPAQAIVAPTSTGIAPVLSRDANTYERMMFAVLAAEERGPVATPAETVAPFDLAAARREVRSQLARPNGAIDLDAVRTVAAHGAGDAGDIAILMRCLRRPEARRPVLDAVAARDDRAGVDLLIRLVLDRATRVDALAAVRRSASPAVVDALIARVGGSPRVDDRLAAARAVGATCDPRALDRMLGMVEADRSRREALAAILSCESPSARQLVARLRLDPGMAAQLVAVRAELDSLFS